MKRTYFLQILLILTSFIAFTAQSQELDYAKSRDYWIVDENQNPVISKVFNLPPNATKSDIYEVVMDLVSKIMLLQTLKSCMLIVPKENLLLMQTIN
jgi:hypothetical protein